MTDGDLHDEIDELALEIEQKKTEFRENREDWDGVFDGKYRRMEEADVDPASLFG